MPQNTQLLNQSHPAFRFIVDVDGERQAAFTECTLPAIEWEAEEVKEGGLNTFVHMLPGMRKATRVTLKNGVGKSALMEWYIQSLSKTAARKALTISLLDSTGTPVVTWQIEEAYPIKWTGPELQTGSTSVAIQALELICGEVVVAAE
jgi:phage tail-like protein